MWTWRANQLPLNGRTVLLTGGSEGTGLSAARQISAKGANVVLVARNVTKLQTALEVVKVGVQAFWSTNLGHISSAWDPPANNKRAQSAAKSPGTQRFHHIAADVSEPGFASRVLKEIERWNDGKPPDIVWCLAGISTPMLWTNEDSLSAARRNMDVNYFGTAEMSQAILQEWVALPKFPEPKHLIFTASLLALFALPGYGPYTPSKWALRGLADTLVMEMGMYPDTPVKVHIVCPNTILTRGFEKEQETKHQISLELEKHDTPESADTVAQKAIAGLERGEYIITTSLLGHLARWAILGGSPRNNWLVDTVMGWVMPVVYFFVLKGLNKQISRWNS